MSYLINLAIGPVQSYISQARRTQDLWLGSQMLSYLASVGVETAADHPGCTMIYPPLPDKSDRRRLGVPNHMMFVCDGTEADAANAADVVKQAIGGAWEAVANNTRAFFVGRFGGESDWRPIWKRQVDHWLEVYWAAVPYASHRHSECVAHANQALAARKLLRRFEPASESGHKCSITGAHEALWTVSPYLKDVRAFWEGVRSHQENLALIKEGERLCALSTIKRIAHEEGANNIPLQVEARFPSTSSIACASFRADVVQQWDVLRDLTVRYLDALEPPFGDSQEQRERTLYFFKDGQPNPETYPYIKTRIPSGYKDDPALTYFMSLDGDFLYDDTLIPPTITEYGGRETTESDLGPARRTLRELVSAAQEKGIRRPHTYLAVLVLDGDQMGEYVGAIADRGRHTELSQALAIFARDTARGIVEKMFPGRLVYSGGDDVLALLPARHALAAANELGRGFTDFMHAKGFSGLHASAGLVFVHHTHNLQDAVHRAQSAIRRAKDHYRGDTGAIGVDLIRRSGEHDVTSAQWDTPVPIRDLVEELTGHFAENRISRGLAFDIEDIAANMAAAIVPSKARKAEFGRILERRSEGIADGALETLTNRMCEFAEGLGPDGQGWHDAARWTRLARFLSQAGKDGDA